MIVLQTKRDLKSRLSEHKKAIEYQRPEKSALCEHSITLDHIIDRNEATILSTEKDYTKRLFAESWLINKSSNNINRNDGNTLPSVRKKLLQSTISPTSFNSFYFFCSFIAL